MDSNAKTYPLARTMRTTDKLKVVAKHSFTVVSTAIIAGEKFPLLQLAPIYF